MAYLGLDGKVKAERYNNLFTLIDEYQPQNIMEIGVWKADNARAMLIRARKYQEKVRYYGFDVFEFGSTKKVKMPEEWTTSSGLTVREIKKKLVDIGRDGVEVHLYKGFTRDTLPGFKPIWPIDFIFIDGGHSFDTIANDWFYCKDLMHEKTVVVFDDYYSNVTDHGSQKLVDEIAKDSKYTVTLLDPLDKMKSIVWGDLDIRLVKVARTPVASIPKSQEFPAPTSSLADVQANL